MPYLSADYILTPTGFLADAALELNDAGTIMALHEGLHPEAVHHRGLLCPGFVNVHCHLELSHLWGAIPQGLGMVPFIRQVGALRFKFRDEEQEIALLKAVSEAQASGTVAIGDIANGSAGFAVKEDSGLYIHTFIECLGVDATQVDARYAQGLSLLNECPGPASLTPHAPYSCARALLDKIYSHANATNGLLSLHLLESQAERDIFNGRGDLVPFYQELKLNFSPTIQDVLSHVLPGLPKASPVLLVHLTELTVEERERLEAWPANFYFGLCPRSNLYLHNKLPDLSLFDPADPRLCLGTDSLASNTSLELLEEVKLLAAYWPVATLEQLLGMATRNGAAFLGIEGRFGAFRAGTAPGVNLISDVTETSSGLALAASSRSVRLF